MNWAIYAAMERIPIGVAVTIEFAGPLGLADLALAQAPRPRLGRARRRRDPAAHQPVRRLGPRRRRRRARAAGGRRLGRLHPDLRAHGHAVPGRPRARDRDGRRRAAGRARRAGAGRQGPARARAARPGRRGRARLLGDPVLARARVAAADPRARVRGADVARARGRRAGGLRRPGPGARRGRPAWRSASSWPRAPARPPWTDRAGPRPTILRAACSTSRSRTSSPC